jgi:hypothetical protein
VVEAGGSTRWLSERRPRGCLSLTLGSQLVSPGLRAVRAPDDRRQRIQRLGVAWRRRAFCPASEFVLAL